MSGVVPADIVEAAQYYQDAQGQIYKSAAPINDGDTIIPFPSESIDAHIVHFGVSGQPYEPADEVIEDRSVATQKAENVKYHPSLTDIKMAEMLHAQSEQLNGLTTENTMLENELEAANAKITELEAEVVDLQKQLDAATAPPTTTTKA